MNMVQMSSIAGAAMVGSGVIVKTQQGFGLAGTGDVVIFFTLIKIPPLIFWLGLIIVNLPENNYKVNPKMLKFEDIRIVRDMRNSVNRIVNCENANMNKVY